MVEELQKCSSPSLVSNEIVQVMLQNRKKKKQNSIFASFTKMWFFNEKMKSFFSLLMKAICKQKDMVKVVLVLFFHFCHVYITTLNNPKRDIFQMLFSVCIYLKRYIWYF